MFLFPRAEAAVNRVACPRSVPFLISQISETGHERKRGQSLRRDAHQGLINQVRALLERVHRHTFVVPMHPAQILV